ncbi:hypothetical protein RRG08_014126 [Elysia crispata]|uniref:Uncharacterized protein n=1 Tax=Elysia crispata TaxID=231223 RepID=A0AAE1B2Q1_9GAST|nr:hypothetical protein RRG08_014126 [Elysia crispata]
MKKISVDPFCDQPHFHLVRFRLNQGTLLNFGASLLTRDEMVAPNGARIKSWVDQLVKMAKISVFIDSQFFLSPFLYEIRITRCDQEQEGVGGGVGSG